MPKRSSKQKDPVQLTRSDAKAPDVQPTKPAANKAKPPRPQKKQDVKDIERADSEGMAQPQGLEAKPTDDGRVGGIKGGKVRPTSLSAAKRKR